MTERINALKFRGIGSALTGLALLASSAANAEPAQAPAAAPKSTWLFGGALLRSASIEDAYQNSRLMGLGIDFDLRHRLTPTWNARVALSLIAETGSSQTFFSDEYKPASSILLTEALVEWRPSQMAGLRLGALNVGSAQEAPLLFASSTTFPGANERLTFKSDASRVELAATQAIPVASVTAQSTANTPALPVHLMESASVAFAARPMEIGFRVSHFLFRNLQPSVAAESRFRGNSVSGVGQSGAAMIYGFQGIEAGGRVAWNLPGWKLATGASALMNFEAPAGQNRGALVFFEPGFSTSPTAKLSPRLELFRNESDSSPGFYNSGTLAHSNRQGISLGMRADFSDSALSLQAGFVRAKVIQPSPFQADFTGVFLNLRKSYELL